MEKSLVFDQSPVVDAVIQSNRWMNWLLPLTLAVLLLVVSQLNFLLFHSLAELFAIMVAMMMCVVAWQTHSFTRNYFVLYVGLGYFWVGVIDLLHTFAYKGLGIFLHGGAPLATQLWILARLLEAVVLLTAPIFINRPFNRGHILWSLAWYLARCWCWCSPVIFL